MRQNTETVKELVARLREADTAYYKYDNPIMTDREYDRLYDELIKLEAETGIILSGSPTQKVSGEILEGLTPVRHTKPMLSAGKTKSVAEIVKFIGGKAAVISWKLDGLTLVLRYENGSFKQAITRGEDGTIGEDVTHTAHVFMNIPLEIPNTDKFEIRGEAVISWENFRRINRELEESYSHPRNLASGSTRRLDASKSREQFLEFFAFELVSDDATIVSKQGQFEKLKANGFDTVFYLPIGEASDSGRIHAAIASFDPAKFDYPVDGLIVEYDDLAYGKSLGATGHHEKRLIALKWEDETYETTFLGLELATTRTGMVSITGKFADTIIDGATVNRAYLHNLDILDSFSLGIGDKVKIYKANKIIPQLAENLTKSGTLTYPTKCPCCGSTLTIRQSVNGTRFLYCENPSCSAKLIRKFVHFCSKTRMNIADLSEKRLEIFLSRGWVKNFGDLYELEHYKEEFIETPGFGEKLFERLTGIINERRQCTLNQFIAAMGIHTVGRSAGRTLNRHFRGDWSAFEQAIRDGFDFTTLSDFGQTMHDNIYAWYADPEAEKLWRPLLKHLTFIIEENETMTTNNPFNGKTVVATGKLENYSRDGIQNKLLSLGAKPASSVSKTTDYLIVGEKAGSKLEKAMALGVTTLTEAQFEALLRETGAAA